MESTINSFRDSFDSWGYIVLFLYCMGSGYVGILAAGVLSSLEQMSLSLSILIATLGNIFGSSMLVYAVRYEKKEFAKYLSKHRRKIALMHLWLRKYGPILIFANKYLYGIKFLVPVAIGVSRYNFKKFLLLNALSCAIWASLLGSVAFYSSKFIITLFDKYGQYSYLVVVAVFGVVLIGIIALNRFSKPKVLENE